MSAAIEFVEFYVGYFQDSRYLQSSYHSSRAIEFVEFWGLLQMVSVGKVEGSYNWVQLILLLGRVAFNFFWTSFLEFELTRKSGQP